MPGVLNMKSSWQYVMPQKGREVTNKEHNICGRNTIQLLNCVYSLFHSALLCAVRTATTQRSPLRMRSSGELEVGSMSHSGLTPGLDVSGGWIDTLSSHY